MVFGYARVSTKGQNIERQIANITAIEPAAVIIKEKFTATTLNRPEWTKLFNKVGAGDTIIFDSVSRMSRNAAEGIEAYFDLYDRGVTLRFIKEPYVNSDVYRAAVTQAIDHTGNQIADIYIDATNTVMKLLAEQQITLAFEAAEKDNNDRRQAIREGMAAVKRNNELIEKGIVKGEQRQIGQQAGRKLNVKKAAAAKEIILKHSKDFNGTLSDPEVMRLAGISRNSYYKYKAELKEALLDDCITDDFTMVSKALKASK